MTKNDRGIALVVTLLVVTLLTIAVVEFTYSVQVNHRLANNALSGMQAQMLARSGVNLGAALLARDLNDPAADWYFEEWASPDIAGVIQLDATQRLVVQVIDESGKININSTRPRAGRPLPVPGQPNLSPDAFLRDALRRLFEVNEVDVDIPDRLLDYWAQEGETGSDGSRARVTGPEDFQSLEDFGAVFGIPASKLRRLSRFVTALPIRTRSGQLRDQGRINVNTAPVEVLTAVVNDAEAVEAIVQRRDGEEPVLQGQLNDALQGMEHRAQIVQLFSFRSSFFRVFSSAMVNADPRGGRLGGVGQTVVALLHRQPIGRLPQDAGPEVPRWTLTPLDWQKRGGAELLVRRSREQEELDQDLGSREW